MKKIIWILLMTFCMIPSVWAEELPREGVTYFLNYPNGVEEVIENYENAINENEILIYEGMTNGAGEIILDNWNREGKLRIVQEVPNGYLTNTKELTIDLSNESVAEFVNYKGTSPKTGNYFINIIIVLSIIGIAFLFMKKKKAYLAVFIFLFLAATVKADGNFTIKVKDNKGNALSNVKVYVYATPTSIEAYPAVKISANGGEFLDGKEMMYLKLPYDNCNIDDIYEYLSPSGEPSYEIDNMWGATRENYFPNLNPPDNLYNGMEISLDWEEDSEAELVTVHANGGYIDFYGQKLDNVRIYKDNYSAINGLIRLLKKEGKRAFGLDVNTSCNNYDENNNYILKVTPDSDDLYACWEEIEDGIYIDGMKFITSPDVCFDTPLFYEMNSANGFVVFNDSNNQLRVFYEKPSDSDTIGIKHNTNNSLEEYDEIYDSIDIYYHKKLVVSINAEELDYASSMKNYFCTNNLKNQLGEYLYLYFNDDCLTVEEVSE